MEKTVADSYTEQIQILMPADINGANRLFGGKLMEWIDVVAAVVARRHSGHDVTTVSVDTLEFRAPAHANDTIILKGHITYVGRTSMEVCVETFIEELSGERRKINKAYLVLVAIDENEKPIEVPQLKLVSEEDKKEWAKGKKRRDLRKQRQTEHY